MRKSLTNFIRCSGLACIPGGALWALLPLGLSFSEFIAKYGIFVSEAVWKLFLPSTLLLMVGLVGIHVRQSRYAGRLGRGGFYVALAGLVLILIGGVGEFWLHTDRFYVMTAPAYHVLRAGLLVLAAGSLLFSIAALRARVLSPWSVSPLVVGSLGGLAAFSWDLGYVGAVLWVLLGAAWAWLGFAPVKISVSLRQIDPGREPSTAIAPNAAAESASGARRSLPEAASRRAREGEPRYMSWFT